MSDRVGRSKLAIGGLAAVSIALLIAATIVLFCYDQQHGDEREQASQYQASSIDREVQATCVRDARSRAYTCTANVPVADGHDPYAEHDLRAQQDMARWALAVVLVSIGTLALTGVGVLLLWWTLEATRHAVEATAAATKAAQDANAGFAEASRRELRAYIAVKSAGVEPAYDQNKKIVGWEFGLEWINTGVTPSRKNRSHTNIALFKHPETRTPEDLTFPDTPSDDLSEERAESSLGRDQLQIVRFSAQEQVDALMKGEGRVFVWAWIEYNDIFEDTPRRRTEFYSEIRAEQVVAGDRSVWRFPLRGMARFNAADKDCYRAAGEPAPKF